MTGPVVRVVGLVVAAAALAWAASSLYVIREGEQVVITQPR